MQLGRPSTFVVSCALILAWAATGPLFRYSDSWQLVANTTTTLVTTIAVLLIQNTQNRDMAVLQVQLAELIRATAAARNSLLAAEKLSDEDLARIKETFTSLADDTRI